MLKQQGEQKLASRIDSIYSYNDVSFVTSSVKTETNSSATTIVCMFLLTVTELCEEQMQIRIRKKFYKTSHATMFVVAYIDAKHHNAQRYK